MKKNLILLFTPVILLAVLLLSGYDFVKEHAPAPMAVKASNTNYNTPAGAPETNEPSASEENRIVMKEPVTTTTTISAGKAQQLLNYATSLLGSPYKWAGETPAGFDCSGFITHVYETFHVDLPHSSAMQAEEGHFIPKHEAAPGDLVIFTGTNPEVRSPGHVGIVMSAPGDTIEFVHSSSNGGVKLSKVQGSGYDERFLEVRRVL